MTKYYGHAGDMRTPSTPEICANPSLRTEYRRPVHVPRQALTRCLHVTQPRKSRDLTDVLDLAASSLVLSSCRMIVVPLTPPSVHFSFLVEAWLKSFFYTNS